MKSLPLLVLLLPSVAWPHDLDATVTVHPHSVVVAAAYGGSEPAPYISAGVFSPADPQREFQSGRTDARGVFAFVPDRPGVWQCILDDELGHRKELTITVDPDGARPEGTPAQAPVPMSHKMLTGVSLLIGLTGLAAWYSSRRMRNAAR